MGLRTQLQRHRGNTRLIVGVLGALLLVLSGIFYQLLYSQRLDAKLINNRVLLFALWYINVVLILSMVFVLMRIVFKMLIERKHRILGSKFKTKLIASYIGLSLIPVLLLFFFANQLLQGSIDRWFNVPLQRLVGQAQAIAEALNSRISDDNLRAAQHALEQISALPEEEVARGEALGISLQELMDESGVDLLAVYDGTDFVRAVLSPNAGMTDLPDLDWSLLRNASARGQATKVKPLAGNEGRLMLLAVADPTRATDRPGWVVVAGSVLEQPLAGQVEGLVQAYQAHRQLVVEKDAIKASHLLIFMMATLLILLASSWVGLYLARRVTLPIQALASGTKRITSGDLSHRVSVDADDELGVLVDSFNRMTEQLEEQRRMLEKSNLELQQSGERQAEERALIAAVLQNVAAGVLSVDEQGLIFTCNGAARSLLRLDDPVLGRPVAEVLGDPERGKLVSLLEALPPDGSRKSSQLHLVVGGEWKTFEVTVTPVHHAEGSFRGRVLVLEDLTELIKAQKLAAWTEAARRIAHEIKNPLTPIKLSAERLLHKHRNGDPQLGKALEDAVETIVREVGSMQNMVDEFSRYARMPAPQPNEVDLRRLVSETLDLYQGIKPGVEVEARVATDAGTVHLDGEQLRRALINLLDNALEATEAPGRVTVTAGRRDDVLTIEVADTGRGIPDSDKQKLFLPYFSTKGRGTGLGLTIVQRIVSDHHGRIRVAANRPHGTVFSLEIPA
ncbi:MAG: HAMP domain-containing protein [Acidobacteria bacterium]|nr:HAMP domain-containing protein [Acidobacteriota bacterium]